MQQTERPDEHRLLSARGMTPRRGGQGGFSLIENMAALLVLAIGLMGVAAMQDFGLSRNTNANEVTLATNLAAEMVERIRNNTKNVAVYNGIDTKNVATKPAAAQVMARGDYEQWQTRLTASRLPFVQGRVTVTAQGPADLNQNLVVVQVIWSRFLFSPVTISTVVAPE
jgi:type IV pilus assembly protein PilV